MMKISILTLFPEMFCGPFDQSIIKRAREKKLVKIHIVNMRDFGMGRHKIVDDKPYGGGVGMILRVDVIDKALEGLREKGLGLRERIILLDPRGETFSQRKAQELSKLDHLILIAGHYEGVDERAKNLVDQSLSIGDYVLTGGEIAAMVVVDGVVRLIPRVLVKPQATKLESFSKAQVIEHPQYTRPPLYRGWEVPPVLLSGDHQKIEAWRRTHTLVKRVTP